MDRYENRQSNKKKLIKKIKKHKTNTKHFHIINCVQPLGDVRHALLFSIIFRILLVSFIYCGTWMDFLSLCYELKICCLSGCTCWLWSITVFQCCGEVFCNPWDCFSRDMKFKNMLFKCHIDCYIIFCSRHLSLYQHLLFCSLLLQWK